MNRISTAKFNEAQKFGAGCLSTIAAFSGDWTMATGPNRWWRAANEIYVPLPTGLSNSPLRQLRLRQSVNG